MTLARSFLLAIAVAALGACSSTKVADAPVPAQAPAPAATATPAAQRPATGAPAPVAQSAVKTVTVHPLDDPKSPLAKRSVFFEFDSAQISSAETPVVEAHAKYLSANRSAQVKIEGHCDERGGREYNLALGQRRAEAVRKSLQLLGVPDAETEAISFGKEKPLDPGHDEAAWAKNRRADLNYLRR